MKTILWICTVTLAAMLWYERIHPAVDWQCEVDKKNLEQEVEAYKALLSWK